MANKYEQGQSTVEFILTFAFGVSLIFVIFTTALNYATGYLVHYATFMASRVYLTQDSHIGSPNAIDISFAQAEERAKTTFSDYKLSAFGISDGNFRINKVGPMGTGNYLTVGGVTVFEQKIDVLGRITGGQKLELVSESFLGKEPTRATCAARICEAITGGTNCATASNYDITLFDDGC